MKKYLSILLVINIVILFILSSTSYAYWVWTPETKKFINPKYAVKDSPAEQYNWAMDFYDAKDYKRAAIEFEKLVKNYEYSEYAAKAQYYAGLSYENEKKYYIAYTAYQKAIDNYPRIENIEEIIAREFNIADIYASKESPKVLGTDIMTSDDRAIEIFKKVVDNAPFGALAEEAQFRLGQVLKDSGRYDEATLAFQRIIDDYPKSKFIAQARYEMANCAYHASLKPAYDSAPTEKALKAFEDFTNTNKDSGLSKEADETINRLKDKAAQKSFNTAKFYEQMKRYKSAIIYYKDVIEKYPDTPTAALSKDRIECLTRPPAPRESINWTPWQVKDKPAKQFEIKAGEEPAEVSASIGKEEARKEVAKEKSKGWLPWWGKKSAAGQPCEVAPKPASQDRQKVKKSWFSSGDKEPAKGGKAGNMKWSIFAPLSYFDKVHIPQVKIASTDPAEPSSEAPIAPEASMQNPIAGEAPSVPPANMSVNKQ